MNARLVWGFTLTLWCSASCSGPAAPIVPDGAAVVDGEGIGDAASSLDASCEAGAACGDLCVDLQSSPSHCGDCDTACPDRPHGAAACAMGRCAVTCAEGFADCDGDPTTGCEVELARDIANCGACGQRCELPGGAPRCNAGVCEIDVCPVGRKDCNRAFSDACEAEIATSAMHCGACDSPCAPVHATGGCDKGTCRVTACDEGFANCNGDAHDGCEADLRTSTAHCGMCGSSCTPPHATPSCADGRCAVASCEVGFADCNRDPSDGCEVDTRTATSHCGACGNACAFSNGAATCADGVCGGACGAGYSDCNHSAADGCEVDTDSDRAQCGACGHACAAGEVCTHGACRSICGAGETFCTALGVCADLAADVAHCGACETRCPTRTNATSSCAAGACRFACAPGFADCDGDAANGCEVALTTTSDCGACRHACAYPHAGSACAAGACAVGPCAGGYGNCDGDPANGCETALSSTSHCGGCGARCAPSNAVGACSDGACAIDRCAPGYGNCNGRAEDGCEVALNSTANCLSCGNACPSGFVCSAAGCVCPAGQTNCGGACVSLSSDLNHCGACGARCVAPTGGSASCTAGRCVTSCPGHMSSCSGVCQPVGDSCINPNILCGGGAGTYACFGTGTRCVLPPDRTSGACGCLGSPLCTCSASGSCVRAYVELCTNTDYTGPSGDTCGGGSTGCLRLPMTNGQLRVPNLGALCSYNDQISSVRLVGVRQVTLYWDSNYGGASVTLTANCPDLHGRNGITCGIIPGTRTNIGDQATSVVIVP